jgi:hypothetical protein
MLKPYTIKCIYGLSGFFLSSMDAIEETTEPGVPDPPGTDSTLYIPDFVPEHVHDDMT